MNQVVPPNASIMPTNLLVSNSNTQAETTVTVRSYVATTHGDAGNTEGDQCIARPHRPACGRARQDWSFPGQLVDGGESVDGGGLLDWPPPSQCEIVTTALVCTGPVYCTTALLVFVTPVPGVVKW
jgi:hypothetical protein